MGMIGKNIKVILDATEKGSFDNVEKKARADMVVPIAGPIDSTTALLTDDEVSYLLGILSVFPDAGDTRPIHYGQILRLRTSRSRKNPTLFNKKAIQIIRKRIINNLKQRLVVGYELSLRTPPVRVKKGYTKLPRSFRGLCWDTSHSSQKLILTYDVCMRLF
jgi:hypothetical protein